MQDSILATPEPTPADEPKPGALGTAQRLRDYRSHGEQPSGALAASRRRIQEWGRKMCQEWLSNVLETHEALAETSKEPRLVEFLEPLPTAHTDMINRAALYRRHDVGQPA